MRAAPPPGVDHRLLAAIDLIGRTGAEQFMLQHCDEEPPTVWFARVRYQGGWECAAAMDPNRAVMRLCDQLVDGGHCTHCHRPTGFAPDFEDDMPLPEAICWYQYDPERDTFRRGCE